MGLGTVTIINAVVAEYYIKTLSPYAVEGDQNE